MNKHAFDSMLAEKLVCPKFRKELKTKLAALEPLKLKSDRIITVETIKTADYEERKSKFSGIIEVEYNGFKFLGYIQPTAALQRQIICYYVKDTELTQEEILAATMFGNAVKLTGVRF